MLFFYYEWFMNSESIDHNDRNDNNINILYTMYKDMMVFDWNHVSNFNLHLSIPKEYTITNVSNAIDQSHIGSCYANVVADLLYMVYKDTKYFNNFAFPSRMFIMTLWKSISNRQRNLGGGFAYFILNQIKHVGCCYEYQWAYLIDTLYEQKIKNIYPEMYEALELKKSQTEDLLEEL